ncbi:MAG: hypothetical protein ABIQ12_03625 [Opitutaceae bacterium]
MTGRRAFWSATLVAAMLGLVWLLWTRRSPTSFGQAEPTPVAARVAIKPGVAPPRDAEPPLEGESRLADELNAQGGTIQRDLRILHELFETWQTNFPRTGNPVGENGEITAALSGANPLRFAFLPRGHPAVNPRGELCDRWGTPFRFHALSGQQMEIRSAGPDRTFGTPDDAQWTLENSVVR